MRNLKRMASLLLAMVMMMSLMLVPAQAAGGTKTGNDSSAPYPGNHNSSISVTLRDSYSGKALSGGRFKLEDITAGRYQTYEVKTTDGLPGLGSPRARTA